MTQLHLITPDSQPFCEVCRAPWTYDIAWTRYRDFHALSENKCAPQEKLPSSYLSGLTDEAFANLCGIEVTRLEARLEVTTGGFRISNLFGQSLVGLLHECERRLNAKGGS